MLDSLTSFSPSKLYVKDAGLWINDNSSMQAKVLSTDLGALYYSKRYNDSAGLRPYLWDDAMGIIESNKWGQYDFLVFHVKGKSLSKIDGLVAKLPGLSIKKFSNTRGDSVVIFYKPDREK